MPSTFKSNSLSAFACRLESHTVSCESMRSTMSMFLKDVNPNTRCQHLFVLRTVRSRTGRGISMHQFQKLQWKAKFVASTETSATSG